MSFKDRIKRNDVGGLYGVVAGLRLLGKTTLAGTLPGKTILFQAQLLETASSSAEQLAKELGNSLDTIEFSSVGDLRELLLSKETKTYDNVYIDGLSAVSEMIYNGREIQALLKKNQWEAFREIGDELREFQLMCKQFTIDTGKNLFMDPVVKGQVALEAIKKYAPVVVAVTNEMDESGNLHRFIITKSDGVYPARIDSVLDHNNPGRFEADNFSEPSQAGLAGLINFLKGA
jgi:hypothetical protein